MELVVRESVDRVAAEAARRVVDHVRRLPTAHIGLATGGTQQGVYRVLADAHRRGEVSFAGNTFFMLDEYAGIPATSPHSFQHVLWSEFLGHVDAARDALRVLDGTAPDLSAEAERYERVLEISGGIDLQLLGIGTNGHIGFNEPGSPADSRTREVDLHPDTLVSNAPYFASIDDVPKHAITQGLGTIMEARSIVLIATGVSKAPAIAAMVDGEASLECPGSVLQGHSDITVIVDEAAASLLALTQQ